MNDKRKTWPVIAVLSFAVILAAVAIIRHRQQERQRTLLEPEIITRAYLPLVTNGCPGKKGVAMPSGRCGPPRFGVGANFSRAWWPNAPACAGVASAPCVCFPTQADEVLAGTQAIIPRGTNLVLSANEPDDRYQAAILPQEWIGYQHDLVAQFPGYDWASPATVWWPYPSPFGNEFYIGPWLQNFVSLYFAQYGVVPFSVLDWHCYYPTAAQCIGQAGYFLSLMDWLNSQYGNPIKYAIVSEVGLSDPGEFSTFLDWMDNEDRIRQYYVYCNEDANYPQFSLWEFGSNPVILTDRGEAFGAR